MNAEYIKYLDLEDFMIKTKTRDMQFIGMNRLLAIIKDLYELKGKTTAENISGNIYISNTVYLHNCGGARHQRRILY